ncbi:hypothetical protein [Alloactinosynnema sp. L-07]|uniref:hypothetical protein n=1 Tax=Alloactinosynnema sp. L-07 TaxID=1653480 RepID=UPI00065F08F0|nr:hypothetical protein [Alloactinosynnema sp. L-07]CRK55121.1 hypothetical protein [Alloactinosynnema sp. L-07]
MSQPPYRPPGQPQQPYRPGNQQGGYQHPGYGQAYQQPAHQPGYQPGYEQPQYRDPAPHRPEPRQAPRPAPPTTPPSGGLRIPGLGLILTLVGSLVQILCLTVLPWVSAGNDPRSLFDLWDQLSKSANGFGDWYVVIFSYPLMILGILLAFAAVLESVAMKVVWAGLMLLGLGYLLLRYGFGPLTGSFGEHDFGTKEIVLAGVAVAAVVLVVFVLKTAVTMFRRVAGLVLIALSGVHIYAVMDLVKAADLSELNIGAFGPSLGYLLIGVAALIGPRRFVPGT